MTKPTRQPRKTSSTEKLVPNTFKLAPSELAKIKERASKCGMTVSAYMRKVLASRKTEITVIDPLAAEQWHELADGMTALNKAALDVINKDGFEALNVMNRLEECRCVLAQVRDHLAGRKPFKKDSR